MNQTVLEELLYGRGAHADSVVCVSDIPAEIAGKTITGYPHSVWQTLWHMNYWMEHELKRIRGENPAYPAHASESWPEEPAPPSQDAWDRELKRFAELLAEFRGFAQSQAEVLDRQVPETDPTKAVRSRSVIEVLWQIVAHNSYHLGQIIVLRAALGAGPPTRPDTW